MRARAMDHFFQANNGRARENQPDCLNFPAAVQDETGFSIDDKRNGTASIADIDRLEISV
jgi:hypothetical protein